MSHADRFPGKDGFVGAEPVDYGSLILVEVHKEGAYCAAHLNRVQARRFAEHVLEITKPDDAEPRDEGRP